MLEQRQLMDVSWSFSAGKLEGIGDTADETVVLSVNASGFVVDQGNLIEDANDNPLMIPASSVTEICIDTKRGNDKIDLRAVNSTTFPNISTSSHKVRIEGGWGADTIFGSDLPDRIFGHMGDDDICGMGGSDHIEGGWGDDTICGGTGGDYIDGDAGKDELLGNEGDDHIIGGDGQDSVIDGGAGSDKIVSKGDGNRDTIFHDGSDDLSDVRKRGPWRDNLIEGTSDLACPCDGDGGGYDCEVDFGDAPDTYGTTFSNNGASHHITSTGPRMGMFVDAEGDGQPSVNADEDDLAVRDDEDGVTFVGGPILGAGTVKEILVDIQNLLPGETAFIDGWVDFDGDGSFNGNNQIFASQPVTPGVNFLTFSVPYAGSRLGPTYARFRVSTTGGLGPQGHAIGGEVEDYLLELGCDCQTIFGPYTSGFGCDPNDTANLATQLEFFESNLWDATGSTQLSFDGLEGTIPGDQFAVSHGVQFEHSQPLQANVEGGPVIENLDAFDGTFYPDGATVLSVYPNHVDPLTILFDEPVGAVGSFVAMGKEGAIDTLTIEAFDASDNLIASYQPTLYAFDDADNREGYWTLQSGEIGISKVTIMNDNPTDFGNALIVDDLQWHAFEPLPSFTGDAADFQDELAQSAGAVEVIDFEDVAGFVPGDHYQASHGVVIEADVDLVSVAEGTSPIGELEGYDGQYQSDGSQVLATDADEVSFLFDIPVQTFGLFLANDTDVPASDEFSPYTLRVEDINGNILHVENVGLKQWDDGDSREGFYTYVGLPPGTTESIGKVSVIRNRTDTDPPSPVSPIVIDSLTFSRSESVVDAGDYNGDGFVDAMDYAFWRESLGQVVSPGSQADGNADGVVDLSDYAIWRQNLSAAAPGTDVNADGSVDGIDLDGWRLGYGNLTLTDPVIADSDDDGIVSGTDFLNWQRAATPQPVPVSASFATQPTIMAEQSWADSDQHHSELVDRYTHSLERDFSRRAAYGESQIDLVYPQRSLRDDSATLDHDGFVGATSAVVDSPAAQHAPADSDVNWVADSRATTERSTVTRDFEEWDLAIEQLTSASPAWIRGLVV